MMFQTGTRNLITDVAGLKVGNAADARLKSGVTAILCDDPAVAGVQILGGAPGTRETDLLEPHNSVEAINAIVLSGGSAFGLDAASGAQAALRERGIGFDAFGHTVPIVPAAILFDLVNGGDKDWGRYPPYRELGYEAACNASVEFALGTAGAGAGATTAGLKGGLGSASTRLANGITIGALAAANAAGSMTVGSTRHFWAAPQEIGDEFGGLGFPHPFPPDAQDVVLKRVGPIQNTTIAVIATDAVLKANGAVTDYWKTGHSYIKRRVAELGAVAGFEKSGHFFFNPPFGRGYDDGLVTAIAVCAMLDRNPRKTMADLYRDLPLTFGTPTMSPHCDDDRKYGVVERVVADFEAMKAGGETFAGQRIAELVTVNGVRVVAEDGTWGLVRASSNKPELVVVVESPVSADRRRQMFEGIDAVLRRSPDVGPYNQTF